MRFPDGERLAAYYPFRSTRRKDSFPASPHDACKRQIGICQMCSYAAVLGFWVPFPFNHFFFQSEP
jgi:hypothetical protein